MPHLDQLFSCISKGELNRLITLINRNTPLVNATNEEGINLLHYSVLQDQHDILIYLVNHSECQLTQCDSHHYQHTALHTACLLDSNKAAQTIIQKLKPSELNTQDKFGWTALHHACRNGNVFLCKLLIQHRAKPGIQNKLGKSPIHYATQYGYQEIVKLLYDLVGPTVTPNPTEKLSLPILTLMHCAAMSGHTHLVQWLQSVHYPPNVKCRRALHQNGEITSDELPEETAGKRGHLTLKAAIQAYNTQYEMWLQDIIGDCSPLEYVKLCLCGPVDSGKTTLKDRLERTNLQLMLGIGLDSTESSETSKKYTYGVDVSVLQVTSREGFSLYDFCGDIDNYVTHCHFMTSEHTGYVIVLDLTTPTDTLQHQLDDWLTLIKNHNLGSELVYQGSKHKPDIVEFSTSSGGVKSGGSSRVRASTVSAPSKLRDRLYSTGARPLITSQMFNPRSHSAIDQSPSSPTKTTSTSSKLLSPMKSIDMEILPAISQVPVIVVGSHYDCLQSSKERKAILQKLDGIVNEASRRYYRSLNVIPQVFPVRGGDKTSTSEVRYLKEQLLAVRNLLIENSQKFPRVFDKVAKKVESMKIDYPEQKIFDFMKFCDLVRTDVNGLLSDSQIAHVLKHLHNTGIVVYTHFLSQWVFLDPSWLCTALGYVFSPSSHPSHILCKNGEITRKILQTYLPSCNDPNDISTLFKIIRNLELGYSPDRSESYRFGCLGNGDLTETEVWPPDDRYQKYNGRIMLPCTDIDSLPLGFVPHLHMHMVYLMNGKDLRTYNQGFVIDKPDHQCLVKVEPNRRSISFIGRVTSSDDVSDCISTMDYAQQSVTKLCRTMCPAIFFKWSILNPVSLKNHDSIPPCWPASMVAFANRRKVSVVTAATPTEHVDTAQMMFFGDRELMLKGTGLGMKVAYLDDHILEQMGQLLAEDGIQPGWKSLAMRLNLSEYIEILEGESHPVKKLILKWGEKPRWTVNSLLIALKEVNREDAFDYLRAKTNPKYDDTGNEGN